MSNLIPERLINFKIYLDGITDLKGTADIQLPSLEPMTDTVKGAGIAGEYDSPTLGHFQSMKLGINWRTVTKDVVKAFRQKSQRLDCRGAVQTYDAARGTYKTSQVRVVCQGPPTKLEFGKFEPAASSDGNNEFEVLYLKIEIDGEKVVEIDKLNYICIIDGVDYLAEVRKALGM